MAFDRAEAFLLAGELDAALDALDEHLQAHPNDGDARRLRIDVLIRLPGRLNDALADLNALPDLTAEDYAARFGTLLRLAPSVEVEEVIIGAHRRYPNHPALADLALGVLYQRGASEQALEALAEMPRTPHWLAWSGRFYALKGDYRIAAEHYCTALDQLGQPDDPLLKLEHATLLLLRADAYRRLKQYAEADADYRSAEAIVPNDPMIPFNRGLLIFEQGELRRALPLCRDALDRAPDALRDLMSQALRDEPRYHPLAQALLG